jgi:hypothetical protein
MTAATCTYRETPDAAPCGEPATHACTQCDADLCDEHALSSRDSGGTRDWHCASNAYDRAGWEPYNRECAQRTEGFA